MHSNVEVQASKQTDAFCHSKVHCKLEQYKILISMSATIYAIQRFSFWICNPLKNECRYSCTCENTSMPDPINGTIDACMPSPLSIHELVNSHLQVHIWGKKIADNPVWAPPKYISLEDSEMTSSRPPCVRFCLPMSVPSQNSSLLIGCFASMYVHRGS